MEDIKSSTNPKSQPSVVKPLEDQSVPVLSKATLLSRQAVTVYIIVLLFGVISGGVVYGLTTNGTVRVGGKRVQVVKTETEEGVKDAAAFKDTATGKLVPNDGKITKDGTHVIERDGPSQNVYLTSSVVDLTKYENKLVQVWGDTYQGTDLKTGWLIDVGRVKIVE